MELLKALLPCLLLQAPLQAQVPDLSGVFDGKAGPVFQAAPVRTAQAGPKDDAEPAIQGAPATQKSWADTWKQDLMKAWGEELGKLEQTKEHARFVKDNRVSIEIVSDSEYPNIEGFVALYDKGKLYANDFDLAMARLQLSMEGVEPDAATLILARKTLPFIAHELRHGMTQKEVEKACGTGLEVSLTEDEVLSFTDQADLLKALRQRHPELAKHSLGGIDDADELILKAAASGASGLRSFIQEHYKIPSVLADTPESTLQSYREARSGYERTLAIVKGLNAMLARDLPQDKRQEIAEALAKLPEEATCQEFIRRFDAAIAVFSDPQLAEKLRYFYMEKGLSPG